MDLILGSFQISFFVAMLFFLSLCPYSCLIVYFPSRRWRWSILNHRMQHDRTFQQSSISNIQRSHWAWSKRIRTKINNCLRLWLLYKWSGFQLAKQGPSGRAECYGAVSGHKLILEQRQQQWQEPRAACVFGAAPAEHMGNCSPWQWRPPRLGDETDWTQATDGSAVFISWRLYLSGSSDVPGAEVQPSQASAVYDKEETISQKSAWGAVRLNARQTDVHPSPVCLLCE